MGSVVVLLALAIQARADSRTKVDIADLPIPPGAVDVVRRAVSGAASVAYDVRETYPAPQTIAFLLKAMSRRGWRLVEAGGFKSSWPQFSESGVSVMGTPPRSGTSRWPTHFWTGRWRGRGGIEAVFRLRYSCPMETSGMHSVWVQVMGDILGPEEAARQEAARRRIREECRLGRTSSPECEE